jgi:NAD:arginine ADP-ribosyltransferase
MDKIETYVKSNLLAENKEIENTSRKREYPQLTTYEKTIIYKYSNDGFKDINEELRKSRGKYFSEFAKYLKNALNKLPNFDGLVYRKVYLTKNELTKYKNALRNNRSITEYPFTSTTKSRLIAMNFKGTTTYKPNCLFRMQIKTGKEIDKIAKFDEKEVLVLPNTTFKVLEISKESNYTLITIEEI